MDYKSIYNIERQRLGLDPVKTYFDETGPPHDKIFTGYFIYNGMKYSTKQNYKTKKDADKVYSLCYIN